MSVFDFLGKMNIGDILGHIAKAAVPIVGVPLNAADSIIKQGEVSAATKQAKDAKAAADAQAQQDKAMSFMDDLGEGNINQRFDIGSERLNRKFTGFKRNAVANTNRRLWGSQITGPFAELLRQKHLKQLQDTQADKMLGFEMGRQDVITQAKQLKAKLAMNNYQWTEGLLAEKQALNEALKKMEDQQFQELLGQIFEAGGAGVGTALKLFSGGV